VFVRKTRVTKNMKWRTEADVGPWSGEYYQLVESHRPEGTKTPRQRLVLHLGTHATVDEALDRWPREVKLLRTVATLKAGSERAEKLRAAADHLEEKLATLRRLREEGKA
jgi:hypothetical protein